MWRSWRRFRGPSYEIRDDASFLALYGRLWPTWYGRPALAHSIDSDGLSRRYTSLFTVRFTPPRGKFNFNASIPPFILVLHHTTTRVSKRRQPEQHLKDIEITKILTLNHIDYNKWNIVKINYSQYITSSNQEWQWAERGSQEPRLLKLANQDLCPSEKIRHADSLLSSVANDPIWSDPDS